MCRVLELFDLFIHLTITSQSQGERWMKYEDDAERKP